MIKEFKREGKIDGIEPKISFTKNQLTNIFDVMYSDIFEYGRNYKKIWKEHKNSNGFDHRTYVENMIKKVFK